MRARLEKMTLEGKLEKEQDILAIIIRDYDIDPEYYGKIKRITELTIDEIENELERSIY